MAFYTLRYSQTNKLLERILSIMVKEATGLYSRNYKIPDIGSTKARKQSDEKGKIELI
jgi:hypothetical protein